jgi:hypothetical protein
MKKIIMIFLFLLYSNISYAEEKLIKIVYNGIENILETNSVEYKRLNWLIYKRHLTEQVKYDSEFVGTSVILEKIKEDKVNNILIVYLK